MGQKFKSDINFTKVDKSLGLVFGWGAVCLEKSDKNGEFEEYYDTQGHHFTEDCMLDMSTDFAKSGRVARDMHIEGPEGMLRGSVVFMFPMTSEIAKAFNISTDRTGLMVGMQPEDETILNKFASGEYTGFSVGGAFDPASVEVIND